jgi:hypothetical protein
MIDTERCTSESGKCLRSAIDHRHPAHVSGSLKGNPEAVLSVGGIFVFPIVREVPKDRYHSRSHCGTPSEIDLRELPIARAVADQVWLAIHQADRMVTVSEPAPGYQQLFPFARTRRPSFV